ncbi:hypothetical protein LZC95_18850 [Pendulispora brunnea]|uniref:Uncharacterized protein n=1 Tax=Pendulispora brunnea TaxID=2905690 RepID=A0ABZ2KLC3_9BACT
MEFAPRALRRSLLDKPTTKNDLNAAVPKFCLAVEEHRRTPEGRVRTSQEFLNHFFPYDDAKAKDQLFRYIPNDVRGPILAHWGIRGLKAAVRDTDDKVEAVVHDALVAGDVDHAAFELGLPPDVVVRWVPLSSWWTFWRGGKLSKKAIHKALEEAYDLGLFDARWFLDTVEGRGGKLRGTDVIAEGLTKADLTEWIKKIHQSGDGSPRGILAAVGWDKLVSQTPNDVLIGALDALALKVGLVQIAESEIEKSLSGLSLEPLSGGGGVDGEAKTSTTGRVPRETDAPEVSVGETEVAALNDDGMVVIIDDDPASDEEPSAPGISAPAGTLASGGALSSPPLPSIGNPFGKEVRKLNEEEEDQTAVFTMVEKSPPTSSRGGGGFRR